MIKLLVLLMLLVGHAASAAPSAKLSVQVVPSTLNPPPQAAAAGFTTLALNSDFTTMPSSAIGCTADGPAGSSGWGWSGAPLPTNPLAGCGTGFFLGTDQGSQALFIHWQPSFSANCSTSLCTSGVTTANGPAQFPLNAYVEVTLRANVSAPGSGGFFGGLWSWWPHGSFGCDGFERDFLEMASSTQDFALVQWDPACGGVSDGSNAYHYNTDISSYHTYGVLAQGNSAQTFLNFTGYLDNNLLSSVGRALTSAGVAQNKNWLILDQIPQNTYDHTADIIVKSVHVWTCANWQTTNCFPGQ